MLQDIEVGKPVRPQLAMRVSDATAAWKKVLFHILLTVWITKEN